MRSRASLFGALLVVGCARPGASTSTSSGPDGTSGAASSSSATAGEDSTGQGASEGSGGARDATTAEVTGANASTDDAGSDGGSTGSGGPAACIDSGRWTIGLGGAVDIDGVVADGEWDDATEFAIEAGTDWTVPVGIKHDGESLLLVFASFQPPAPPPFAVFPEVMIDVGLDAGRVLGPDDFWFHVSATDCSAVGALDEYDDCVPEARTWEANNFPQGRLINLIEIRIPFATLGLAPRGPEDFGLLLRLSDTQGFATHWPPDADPRVPATWAPLRRCP